MMNDFGCRRLSQKVHSYLERTTLGFFLKVVIKFILLQAWDGARQIAVRLPSKKTF